MVDTNFRFIVIYANLANVLVALFGYALICYITVKYLYDRYSLC